MKTWSVEIGPDYHDDTFIGTHDECLAHAQSILKDYPDAEIQLAEIEDDNGMCTYTYDIEELTAVVEYSGGESRTRPGKAVDYMLAKINGVELYAEADPDSENESGTYNDLKSAILAQAAENNVPAACLRF